MKPANQHVSSDVGPTVVDRRGVPRPGRTLAYVASATWMMILLVGLGWGALRQMLGSASCEPFPGSSTYGTFAWSVFPPGPTCTFTMDVHGFDEVRGPTPVMSVWLLVLVTGGALCVALFRRSRRPRPTVLSDGYAQPH